MTQDFFLKIAGIDGESKDAVHKNELEVLDWSWQTAQQSAMHSGSGGGTGKANVDDLVLLRSVDRASPNLMKYCLTGKHIPQAVFVARKAGGKPLDFFKITMSDVIITSLQTVADDGDDSIHELVRLSFSKVTQEYTVQNAQGGSAGVVTAGFDIKRNCEM